MKTTKENVYVDTYLEVVLFRFPSQKDVERLVNILQQQYGYKEARVPHSSLYSVIYFLVFSCGFPE